MRTILRTALVGLMLATAGAPFAQYYTEYYGPYNQRPWTVVTMSGDAFGPQTTVVRAGTTIVWPNTDEHFHAITADVPGFGPNSDMFFRGGYPGGYYFWWNVPDDAPSGTVIYYHCRFHGQPGDGWSFGTGMVGRIVVL